MQLRLSLTDRLWSVVRWLLGLTGAVVVLWVGAAFLAASPAAAAVAVPVAVPVAAAQQGLQEGGNSRLTDSDNSDSDTDESSSDDKGSDEGESENDSDKGESQDARFGDETTRGRSHDEESESRSETERNGERNGESARQQDNDEPAADEAPRKRADGERDGEREERRGSEEQLGNAGAGEETEPTSGERTEESRTEESRTEGSEERAGDRNGSEDDERARARNEQDAEDSEDAEPAVTVRQAGDAEHEREDTDREDTDGSARGDNTSVDDRVREFVQERLRDAGTERRTEIEEAVGDARASVEDALEEIGDRRSARDDDKNDDTDEADRDRADRADRADGDRDDRLVGGRRLVERLSERAAERLGEDERSSAEEDDVRERAGELAVSVAERWTGLAEDIAEGATADLDGLRSEIEDRVRDAARRASSSVEDPGASTDDPDQGRSQRDRGEQARESGDRHVERALQGLRERVGDSGGEDGAGREVARDVVERVTAELAGRTEQDRAEQDRAEQDRAEHAREDRGQVDAAERWVQRVAHEAREWSGAEGAERASEDFAQRVSERVATEFAERSGAEDLRAVRAQTDDADARGADARGADVERWVEHARALVREATERGDRDDRDGADRADEVADAVRGGLVREAVRLAADRSGVSEDDVRRVVDSAREQLSGDEAGAVEETSAEESARAQLLAASVDGDQAPGVAGDGDAGEQQCARAGEECGAASLQTRDVSLLGSRGPPQGEQAQQYDAELFGASDDENDRDTDRDTDGEWVDGEWVEYDDSTERTERVLEGRIEVEGSKTRLAEEEKKVASGEVTAEQHEKNKATHEELTRQVEADRAELSPERVELVDEVGDGHRQLSEREAQLTAEEQQVAAGAVDQQTHSRNVADFEAQRDEVYEATDELMSATERDARVVPEDGLDGEGSVAGCGSDGAFVECGSVSESADGERTEDRCVALSGVSSGCGASSKSGENESSASCVLSGAGQGCGSSVSGRGADGEETGASAQCSGDARECGQHSMATPDGAASSCASGAGGSCRSDSTGSKTDRAEAQLASMTSGAAAGEARRPGSSTAHCEASSGCDTETSVDLDRSGEVVADAEVGCAAATGCTGSAATSTDSDAGASTAVQQTGAQQAGRATTSAKADCSVSGGLCAARSSSAGESESSAAGDSDATVEVGCDAATCTGRGATATTGSATGAQAGATRDSSGQASCEAAGAGCEAYSTTQVDSEVREPRARLTATGGQPAALVDGDGLASSTAGASVDCAAAACTGAGSSTTSGAASGDVIGVRDSTASSSCTARGAGGGCTTSTDTSVADRKPLTGRAAQAAAAAGATPVSGPVSVSHASAQVACSGAATECGGTASSSTSARDTAVSPHARGTAASTECTVTGGGCRGETSSAASSAPDFVVTDPATGKPLAGQPLTGPSSTSSSSASLACEAGTTCSGTVRTSTSAWDGAVANGAPRTSEGTASCTGATGGCEVQSVSNASAGPGAALALSSPQQGTEGQAGAQQVNLARLPAGPSAASAAGAALTCEGTTACTRKVTSSATATDPSVSPDPRGSSSEGSCEGVRGGVCQAVTNSGASSGPDANVITPLVQARSTANATVTSETTGDEQAPVEGQQGPEQQDPAVPPAPTAPGSSANSGAPTVPGASSWTMASATLDCAGSTSCSGTARSSAAGSDGPTAVNDGNGARGPPEGVSTSSATCTSGQSGCQGQTSSTAGSGQVVADIIAEQQNDAAEQAQQQATEAEQLAAQAARVAAREGATAGQRKTAADAATAAREARTAATEAAELAARPVTGGPATMTQSGATAHCAGPDCTAATTGNTTSAETDLPPATSHTDATCRGGANGCTVASDATTTAYRDSGQADGTAEDAAARRPGSSSMGQTDSQLDCPDAGCVGRLSGTATAPAGTDDSRSTSTGSTSCTGAAGCGAAIGTGFSVTVAPTEHAVSGSSYAQTECRAGGAGCPTETTSTASAPKNSSAASCSGPGSCESDTSASVADGAGTVSAGCTGDIDCRAHAEGHAEAPGNTARFAADCAGGAGGRCDVSGQAVATTEGTFVQANCQGPICRHELEAHSAADAATPGNAATARADCGTTGAAGGGWCGTTAKAGAGPGSAEASASCTGSDGVGCTHSYSARSTADAGGRGSAAHAAALGSGGGGTGGGAVMTTAQASAGRGSASASASCTGSDGVQCSHSYSARSSASARSGANRASASASGSGGGGIGGGGVAVSAQASAGPGSASASASCFGAANCRHSYSAHAAASDSFNGVVDGATVRTSASARADGSGGGGQGGGGVGVSAQASADAKGATASSSCSGAANCSHSYSAHAEAYARFDGAAEGNATVHNRAWAQANGSGGGGQGGGGVGVSAHAFADVNGANSSASCSGAANCSSSFGSHSESSAFYDAHHYAHADADCSGSGNGGCATSAKAMADDKTASASSACDGSPGVACHRSFSAHSDAMFEESTPNGGKKRVQGISDCGGSGGTGQDGCGTMAYAEKVYNDKHEELGVQIQVGCEGTGCRYGATGDAFDRFGNNIGKVHQSCGQAAAGGCSVAVNAVAGSEDGLGYADASGSCAGTPGSNCQGSFSTHADGGAPNKGDCAATGSGYCHSDAQPGLAHAEGIGATIKLSTQIEGEDPKVLECMANCGKSKTTTEMVDGKAVTTVCASDCGDGTPFSLTSGREGPAAAADTGNILAGASPIAGPKEEDGPGWVSRGLDKVGGFLKRAIYDRPMEFGYWLTGKVYRAKTGKQVMPMSDVYDTGRTTADGRPATVDGRPTPDLGRGWNLAHNIGDGLATAVAYAPAGAFGFAEAAGETVYNSSRINLYAVGVIDRPEDLVFRPGETTAEWRNRVDPFFGIFRQSGTHLKNAVGPVITRGDTTYLMNGDPARGVPGMRDRPVETVLSLSTLPAAFAPVGVLGKAAARRSTTTAAVADRNASLAIARANSLADTYRYTGDVRVRDRGLQKLELARVELNRRDRALTHAKWANRAGNVVMAPLYVQAVPYAPWIAAGRAGAAVVGAGVAIPVGAAAGRVADSAANGRARPSSTTLAALAGRTSNVLTGLGQRAREVSRVGVLGSVRVSDAHRALGTTRVTPLDQVRVAHQNRRDTAATVAQRIELDRAHNLIHATTRPDPVATTGRDGNCAQCAVNFAQSRNGTHAPAGAKRGTATTITDRWSSWDAVEHVQARLGDTFAPVKGWDTGKTHALEQMLARPGQGSHGVLLVRGRNSDATPYAHMLNWVRNPDGTISYHDRGAQLRPGGKAWNKYLRDAEGVSVLRADLEADKSGSTPRIKPKIIRPLFSNPATTSGPARRSPVEHPLAGAAVRDNIAAGSEGPGRPLRDGDGPAVAATSDPAAGAPRAVFPEPGQAVRPADTRPGELAPHEARGPPRFVATPRGVLDSAPPAPGRQPSLPLRWQIDRLSEKLAPRGSPRGKADRTPSGVFDSPNGAPTGHRDRVGPAGAPSPGGLGPAEGMPARAGVARGTGVGARPTSTGGARVSRPAGRGDAPVRAPAGPPGPRGPGSPGHETLPVPVRSGGSTVAGGHAKQNGADRGGAAAGAPPRPDPVTTRTSTGAAKAETGPARTAQEHAIPQKRGPPLTAGIRKATATAAVAALVAGKLILGIADDAARSVGHDVAPPRSTHSTGTPHAIGDPIVRGGDMTPRVGDTTNSAGDPVRGGDPVVRDGNAAVRGSDITVRASDAVVGSGQKPVAAGDTAPRSADGPARTDGPVAPPTPVGDRGAGQERDTLPAAPERARGAIVSPAFDMPVFDIRLVWADGPQVRRAILEAALHRERARSTLHDINQIRPTHVAGLHWAWMTNAQRARAWQVHRRAVSDRIALESWRHGVAEQAAKLERQQQHWADRAEALDRAVAGLRRAYDGVLRQANLPAPRREPGRRPQVSGQKEAARAQAEIGGLREQADEARAMADQLGQQRAALPPAQDVNPHSVPGPVTTRRERVAHLSAIRLVEWLRRNDAPILVVEGMARVIEASSRPGALVEIRGLLRAGRLPGERGARVVAAFDERHNLAWDGPTRERLLSVLQQLPPAPWRGSRLNRPRATVWTAPVRHLRAVATPVLLGTGGLTLLGGGFAILGGAGGAALVGGATAAVAGAAALGALRHFRQARAPPARPVVVSTLVATGPAGLLLGGLALAGASGPALLVAGVGVLVGATAVTVLRRATRPDGQGRTRRAVTAGVLLAVVVGAPAALGVFPAVAQAQTAPAVDATPAGVVRVGATAELPTAVSHAGTTPVAGTEELPAGSRLTVAATTPAGQSVGVLTGDHNDKAGDIAAGLGVSFAELNAANGNQFTGPEQSVAGKQVIIPATRDGAAGWDGVWRTQPGNSVWGIFVDRFGDLEGYQRVVDTDPRWQEPGRVPSLIYVGEKFTVTVTPPAPGQGQPGQGQPGQGQPGQGQPGQGQPGQGQPGQGQPGQGQPGQGQPGQRPPGGPGGVGVPWGALRDLALVAGLVVAALAAGRALAGWWQRFDWEVPPVGAVQAVSRTAVEGLVEIRAGLVRVLALSRVFGAWVGAAVRTALSVLGAGGRIGAGVVLGAARLAVLVVAVVAEAVTVLAGLVTKPVQTVRRWGLGVIAVVLRAAIAVAAVVVVTVALGAGWVVLPVVPGLLDWVWAQKVWLGVGAAVLLVGKLRQWLRARGWDRQKAGWEATQPRLRMLEKASVFAAVRVFRLVVGSWVGESVDVDRPGFTVTQIIEGMTVGARHPGWLMQLARQVTEQREAALGMLLLLAEVPQPLLMRRVGADGVERWGPSAELRELLARAPPAAVTALLRDPATTLWVRDMATRSPEELAELVFGFLRHAVRDQDELPAALLEEWEATQPRLRELAKASAFAAVRLARLVIGSWVGESVDVDRPGFTVTQIIEGRTVGAGWHPRWLVDLARQVTEQRDTAWAMLLLLTEGPQPLLVRRVGADGVERWGPSRKLRALLARAPPAAVTALLRDPAKTLGVRDMAKRSPEELAELWFGFLRRVVWDQDAITKSRGWRDRLPVRWFSGRGELKQLMAPLRGVTRALNAHRANPKRQEAITRMLAAQGSGSVLRVVVAWVGLPGDLRLQRGLLARLYELRAGDRAYDEVRVQLEAAYAVQLLSALNRGAVAGFGQKRLEAATRKASMGFVARRIGTILGFFTADAPESALMFTAADEAIANHYRMDTDTLSTVGPWLTAAFPATAFGFAVLGDRMITTMKWLTMAAAVGVAGLAVAGLAGGSGPVGLVTTVVAMAVWDSAMAGPMRARFDIYFPETEQMRRAQRASQLQSSFKAGQMLIRQVYLFGFATVGVAWSYSLMAAVALVVMAVIVSYLSGSTLTVTPRAPPKLKAALRGIIDQVRGTRGGLRRLGYSITIGTMLTGLPTYALGGGTVAIMVRLINPYPASTTFWLVGGTVAALGVSYLSFGPRLLAFLTGTSPIWAALQRRLGTPGALQAMLGRTVEPTPVDEARVLVGISLLGGSLILGAVAWLYAIPGFWPLAILMGASAVYTGWARIPLNGWTAGSGAATLIVVAKGAAVTLGIALGNLAVAGPAARVAAAVDAGAAPEVVYSAIQAAMLNMAILTVILAVVPVLWALGVRKHRIAPWAELDAALRANSSDRGPVILAALRSIGFGDIGSITAVFLDPAPAGREAAQQRRRDAVLINEKVTDPVTGKETTVHRQLNDEELISLRRALTEWFPLGAALHNTPPISLVSLDHTAAIFAALRGGGLGTIRLATAAFLDPASSGRRQATQQRRRDAVRIIDPATGDARELNADELGFVRRALAEHRTSATGNKQRTTGDKQRTSGNQHRTTGMLANGPVGAVAGVVFLGVATWLVGGLSMTLTFAAAIAIIAATPTVLTGAIIAVIAGLRALLRSHTDAQVRSPARSMAAPTDAVRVTDPGTGEHRPTETVAEARTGLLRRVIGRFLGIVAAVAVLVLALPAVWTAPHAVAEPVARLAADQGSGAAHADGAEVSFQVFQYGAIAVTVLVVVGIGVAVFLGLKMLVTTVVKRWGATRAWDLAAGGLLAVALIGLPIIAGGLPFGSLPFVATAVGIVSSGGVLLWVNWAGEQSVPTAESELRRLLTQAPSRTSRLGEELYRTDRVRRFGRDGRAALVAGSLLRRATRDAGVEEFGHNLLQAWHAWYSKRDRAGAEVAAMVTAGRRGRAEVTLHESVAEVERLLGRIAADTGVRLSPGRQRSLAVVLAVVAGGVDYVGRVRDVEVAAEVARDVFPRVLERIPASMRAAVESELVRMVHSHIGRALETAEPAQPVVERVWPWRWEWPASLARVAAEAVEWRGRGLLQPAPMAIRLYGGRLRLSDGYAARMAAADAAIIRELGPADLLEWAGLAPDTALPEDLPTLSVASGFLDYMAWHQLDRDAKGATDTVVVAVADRFVMDARVYGLLHDGDVAPRRRVVEMLLRQWNEVRPRRSEGIEELDGQGPFAYPNKVSRRQLADLANRDGLVDPSELSWSPTEVHPNPWFQRWEGKLFALDPALLNAYFTVVADPAGQPQLALRSARGVLRLSGFGAHPGLMKTTYRPRRIGGWWVGPAEREASAPAEPFYVLLSLAWRAGTGGVPIRVAEGLWQWRLTLPGWEHVFPDGLILTTRTDADVDWVDAQWWTFDDLHPAAPESLLQGLSADHRTTTDTALRTRPARGPPGAAVLAVIDADGDVIGSAVRTGANTFWTVLHVLVDGAGQARTGLRVGHPGQGSVPVLGWETVSAADLVANAARTAPRWGSRLDWAMGVAVGMDDLYGPGEGPAIAVISSSTPLDGTPVVVSGYPGGGRTAMGGLSWRGGTDLKVLLTDGASGGLVSSLADGTALSLVVTRTWSGATAIGPGELLLEADAIARIRAAARGLPVWPGADPSGATAAAAATTSAPGPVTQRVERLRMWLVPVTASALRRIGFALTAGAVVAGLIVLVWLAVDGGAPAALAVAGVVLGRGRTTGTSASLGWERLRSGGSGSGGVTGSADESSTGALSDPDPGRTDGHGSEVVAFVGGSVGTGGSCCGAGTVRDAPRSARDEHGVRADVIDAAVTGVDRRQNPARGPSLRESGRWLVVAGAVGAAVLAAKLGGLTVAEWVAGGGAMMVVVGGPFRRGRFARGQAGPLGVELIGGLPDVSTAIHQVHTSKINHYMLVALANLMKARPSPPGGRRPRQAEQSIYLAERLVRPASRVDALRGLFPAERWPHGPPVALIVFWWLDQLLVVNMTRRAFEVVGSSPDELMGLGDREIRLPVGAFSRLGRHGVLNVYLSPYGPAHVGALRELIEHVLAPAFDLQQHVAEQDAVRIEGWLADQGVEGHLLLSARVLVELKNLPRELLTPLIDYHSASASRSAVDGDVEQARWHGELVQAATSRRSQLNTGSGWPEASQGHGGPSRRGDVDMTPAEDAATPGFLTEQWHTGRGDQDGGGPVLHANPAAAVVVAVVVVGGVLLAGGGLGLVAAVVVAAIAVVVGWVGLVLAIKAVVSAVTTAAGTWGG